MKRFILVFSVFAFCFGMIWFFNATPVLAQLRYVSSDGLCNGNPLAQCDALIQDAVDNASDGDTILVTQETYEEDVTITGSNAISLEGGWDATYATQPGFTTIEGSMTVSGGPVTLEYMVIEPVPVEVLWDNGDPDGIDAFSNGVEATIGATRTLLDDFTVPPGETWTITDFHALQVWLSGSVGLGTDFNLVFRNDDNGSPGSLEATATTVSYSETATGRLMLGRNEYRTDYTFVSIELEEGTYWIEGNVVGPENNFWLSLENTTGSEFWMNYSDYPPLQSGFFLTTEDFPLDLPFSLTGTRVTE